MLSMMQMQKYKKNKEIVNMVYTTRSGRTVGHKRECRLNSILSLCLMELRATVVSTFMIRVGRIGAPGVNLCTLSRRTICHNIEYKKDSQVERINSTLWKYKEKNCSM
jgi:hypothetical protein